MATKKPMTMKDVEKGKADKVADAKHGAPEGSPKDNAQDKALLNKMNSGRKGIPGPGGSGMDTGGYKGMR